MDASGTSPTRMNAFARLLSRWGSLWISIFTLLGGLWHIITECLRWIYESAVSPTVRLGRAAIIAQMVRVGVKSISIVLVVSSCIGLILAMSMYPPLAELGQQSRIANIVGIAVFRELGPLISAIVLTGFAGASIAAEIGTMVVGEEIEAKIIGVDNKTQIINLSIKAKEQKEQRTALEELKQNSAPNATFGDLLKEKIDNSKEE